MTVWCEHKGQAFCAASGLDVLIKKQFDHLEAKGFQGHSKPRGAPVQHKRLPDHDSATTKGLCINFFHWDQVLHQSGKGLQGLWR